jgi:hypothetical protein
VSLEQSMAALQIAQKARMEMAVVRQQLLVGEITLAEALVDERAGAIPVGRLLCSQRQWGPVKAHTLLNRLMIWPTRRVRDLTANQRRMILEAAQR